MAAKRVFGPVPSRRLGLSLGVDLVPLKVCTYDCVYCQLGRTTRKTLDRAEYWPVEEILHDVRTALAGDPKPDYVTLSGSGEPTLHSGFGDVIRGIKALTRIPVVLLTNGSLFFDPRVRKDAGLADLVMPSLDAGDAEAFERVNRPDGALTFEKVVEGLVAFRGEFDGPIWLEVFLVAGVTDTPEEVMKIARHAERINPDEVQLNTAVRPTAEADVRPLARERMESLAELFTPTATSIADYPDTAVRARFASTREAVLALLQRRPCTLEDISAGLGIHRNEVTKHLADLGAAGAVTSRRRGSKDYFRAS